MEIEFEMHGFYTRYQDGYAPVQMWIGSVDLPDDLGRDATEPVVSLIVRSPDPETPIMSFAAFWESAALDGRISIAEPFEVNDSLFARNHTLWRHAFDKGEAYPWHITPNEAYVSMIKDIAEGLKA